MLKKKLLSELIYHSSKKKGDRPSFCFYIALGNSHVSFISNRCDELVKQTISYLYEVAFLEPQIKDDHNKTNSSCQTPLQQFLYSQKIAFELILYKVSQIWIFLQIMNLSKFCHLRQLWQKYLQLSDLNCSCEISFSHYKLPKDLQQPRAVIRHFMIHKVLHNSGLLASLKEYLHIQAQSKAINFQKQALLY